MPAKHSLRETEVFDQVITLLQESELEQEELRNIADSLGNVMLDLVNSKFSLPFTKMGALSHPYSPGDIH